MKELVTACTLLVLVGSVPAMGHHYDHPTRHGQHCRDCSQPGRQSASARTRTRGPASRDSATAVQLLEGTISEVIYLTGAGAGNGMVEIRLQSASQQTQIRLAPSGFLKQGGLSLREGDSVTVKGYRVDSLEGDLVVATQIKKGDKVLELRDALGRSGW